MTMLACAECFDDWRDYCEVAVAQKLTPCEGCGQAFRHLHDIIPVVIPL